MGNNSTLFLPTFCNMIHLFFLQPRKLSGELELRLQRISALSSGVTNSKLTSMFIPSLHP